MKYFARIKKQPSGGYLVEFPELHGCLTEGRTLARARENAAEALNGWLASNCDRGLNIPEPKVRKAKGYYGIDVELSVEFALVRRLRKKQGLTQAQLARKLGISQQAYAKLEAPLKTNPSLHTIQKIGKVLGADIGLRIAA